jgi:adenylate kinase
MSDITAAPGRPTDLRRLIIMGPPGAGKGTTQACSIAARFGVPAVSTGDFFRGLRTADTPVARRVRGIMAAGGYVDDETTNAIVGERLAAADCRDGFLLDGYPRTLGQVDTLDELLAVTGHQVDAVLCLQAGENELVERLLHRGHAQGRVDDTEQTIRTRLAVYAAQTLPLLETYRQRGLLTEVDGLGEVAAVSDRIHQALTRAECPRPAAHQPQRKSTPWPHPARDTPSPFASSPLPSRVP